MGRKSAPAAVSKISSASSPATTASSRTTSVLKSVFAPSQFQLHLFASVIQSFDSHQLRIHDTTTGRLRCQHDTRPGTKITCLDWGYYGAAYREQRQSPSKKKRKRNQDNIDGAVIAFGTNGSEICMLSPTEGKIVGILSGAHERGVRDFKFSLSDYLQGWSIGEDAKLIQWDLTKDQQIRVITLPDPAINVLASPSLLSPQILCASATPFGLDLTSSDDFRIQKFDSFKNPIHSLLRSGSDAPDVNELFLAADADRYLNIYDISEKKLVRTLVAGSGVVELDMSGSTAEPSDVLRQQLLCVVTKDGTVELFVQPFTESKQVNGDLKSSRKNLTKKASASVRLVSAESKSKQVPIVAASLQGPDLVVVSVEAGVDLAFQKVRWQDEGNGELLFEGTKEVVKVKSASTLNVATLNGVKDLGKSQVDESRTVVVNGGAGLTLPSDAIEISSSDSEGEEDEEQESADEAKPELDDEDEEHLDDASNGDSDEEMADADEKPQDNVEDAEMDNGAEPTFGELLASRHPHEISIASALQPDSSSTLTVKNGRPVIPSGMSLGTVLTQSLRTNDQNLLEACLHTLDIDIVRNTIQRLDSSLAGILLSKLAERLASRPGRYGNLITWVQWTCIAHGGAIASQPDVSSKIGTLYQVLTQRMNTFGPLQLLKGKLDMLEAQLTYRRQLAAHRPTRRDDHDEPGMIYIEGADNWDSDVEDEDLDETADRPAKRARAGTRDLGNILNDDEGSDDEDDADAENDEEDSEDDGDDDDEEDEDEDMIKLNGQQNGFLDVEAEVSSAEDSDPADDDNDQSSEVASSSGSDEESEVDEEDEEEDSEMDSFINDGSVDFERDDDTGIHIPGDGESDVDEDDALPVPKTEKVSKAKAKANSEPATKQKKMKRN